MRKKQMLALFMSLSLLAQGMLFSGCGQKSIGEEPAQTRTETEEAQSMETSDSKKQDQTSETDEKIRRLQIRHRIRMLRGMRRTALHCVLRRLC
ncbi:hypothetical protein [Gallintestinimicrobium sp.]|uniref:hypothetical protein n=1 Tax=Gallintestinimicrobium sp. TaxID=2981655 RepID=UPI0039942177